MAKTITLRYDARCKDCGAHLPAGTRARYYKRGFIYGFDCHEQKPRARSRSRRSWRMDDPIHVKPFLSDRDSVRKEPMILHEGPDGVWAYNEDGTIRDIG